MQEINLISLLQKYSGEIVVATILASVVMLLVKKLFKITNKTFVIFAFLVGAVTYFIIMTISSNEQPFVILTNSVTAGALSITVSLIVKRFIFLEDADIKKSLEKLLSSIVLSEQIDEVVDGIIEKISESTATTESELKTIIKENIGKEMDESELDNVVKFIISACGITDVDLKKK